MPESTPSPIFIHSLFRSGSTYISHVFRRLEPHFWCYQEPAHEDLIHLNADAGVLLEIADVVAESLRHPAQSTPYFWEYCQIKDRLKGLFRDSFPYEDYFTDSEAGLTDEFSAYIDALITNAPRRPVLQFCRSSGRSLALKEAFEGLHIHLWREPRNQWWSYKINNYFDATLQCMFNARALPEVLREIREQSGIAIQSGANPSDNLAFAQQHSLAPEANYLAFYALWLYAYIETERAADVSISIDALSSDHAYRANMQARLRRLTAADIDLSDCLVPRTTFTAKDEAFFRGIEDRVVNTFVAHGYSHQKLASALTAQCDAEGLAPGEHELQGGAARAHDVSLRYLHKLHEIEYTRWDERTKADAELKRIAQALEQANTDVQRVTTEHEQKSEALAQTQSALEHVQAEREQAESALIEVRSELGQSQSELAQTRSALTEESARVTRAQAEIDTAWDVNVRLEAEMAQVKTDSDELAGQLETARENHARLQRESDRWQFAADDLAQRLETATHEAAELNKHSHYWFTVASGLTDQLETLHASRSWRLTHPLRVLKKQLLAAAGAVIAFALARPRLRRLGLFWTSKFPALKGRLRRIAESRGPIVATAPALTADPEVRLTEHSPLSEDGRRVLAALMTARDAQKETST